MKKIEIVLNRRSIFNMFFPSEIFQEIVSYCGDSPYYQYIQGEKKISKCVDEYNELMKHYKIYGCVSLSKAKASEWKSCSICCEMKKIKKEQHRLEKYIDDLFWKHRARKLSIISLQNKCEIVGKDPSKEVVLGRMLYLRMILKRIKKYETRPENYGVEEYKEMVELGKCENHSFKLLRSLFR